MFRRHKISFNERLKSLAMDCKKIGLNTAQTIEVFEFAMRRKKTIILPQESGDKYQPVRILKLQCHPASHIPFVIDILCVGLPVTNWGKVILQALERGYMPRYTAGKSTFNTVAGKAAVYEILKEVFYEAKG